MRGAVGGQLDAASDLSSAPGRVSSRLCFICDVAEELHKLLDMSMVRSRPRCPGLSSVDVKDERWLLREQSRKVCCRATFGYAVRIPAYLIHPSFALTRADLHEFQD